MAWGVKSTGVNSLGGECPEGNLRGVSVQGVNSWEVGGLKP